jgi:hypothetical protein
MMKTSEPRTVSCSDTDISPSEKVCTVVLLRRNPIFRHMASAKGMFEFPLMILISFPCDMDGAPLFFRVDDAAPGVPWVMDIPRCSG